MATAPISGTNAAPVRGRSTRQRAAVAAALDEVDEFRSAQELHDVLKHRGDSVGLTTVYRTLQSLADAGEVDVLRTTEGEAVYRRCSTGDHHHHLVCRLCGKAVEVGGGRRGRRCPRPAPFPRPPRHFLRASAASTASAPPKRRSRWAYSRQARHRSRRSKSGQSTSWKTISAYALCQIR